MADLIDDVLDYARLGGTLRATEVDLDFVLGKVLDDLGPELRVTLEFSQLPTRAGRPRPLGAVLQNLLRNAAASAPGTARSRYDIAACTCSAPGGSRSPTTAAAYLPPRAPLFEPFARADDSSGGVGHRPGPLRRIVGAHGGRIGVDPTVTEGARFWFELPAEVRRSPKGSVGGPKGARPQHRCERVHEPRRQASQGSIRSVASCTCWTRGLRAAYHAAPTDDQSRWSASRSARTMASSMAIAAPCAHTGPVACAASPRTTTRSRCQVGTRTSSTGAW